MSIRVTNSYSVVIRLVLGGALPYTIGIFLKMFVGSIYLYNSTRFLNGINGILILNVRPFVRDS